jgi:ribulose-phosphate 3-epimerase
VQAAEAGGADRIHVDVMDGRFVPNITLGPRAVQSLRPLTTLPLETHLMVSPPEDFIEAFAAAGADTILVQQEATPHLNRALQQIRELGKKAGVGLNPSTPAATLSEVLDLVQVILVMTVNPGFGGQEFISGTLRKIRQVRAWLTERGLDCEVEVDGGINEQTARRVMEAGADVLVAGTYIFGAADGVGAAIPRLIAYATGKIPN